MIALRYWREAIGVALLSVIAVLWLSLQGEQRHSRKLQTRLAETQSAFDRTVSDYRAKAEQARRADLAHKTRVEADYARIQMERTNVQKELAATVERLRIERLRKSSGTDTRSPGAKDLPGTPGAPGGAAQPGGATVMDETDKLICEINTLLAEAWHEWDERVRAVPR